MSSHQIEPEPGEFVMNFIDRLLAYADATREPHHGAFNGTDIKVTPYGPRVERRSVAFREWEKARAEQGVKS